MFPTSEIIAKQLSIVPVALGDNPRAKEHGLAWNLKSLSPYIFLPHYFYPGPFKYARQLIFQYNVTVGNDFYILNLDQLRAFRKSIVGSGLLCVKWRVGTTVYRYKLIDSSDDESWSTFEQYTNQRIKKNFCLEFWANTADSEFRGIISDIYIQMSAIVIPTNINQQSVATDIEGAPFTNLDGGTIIDPSSPTFEEGNSVTFNVEIGSTYSWIPGANETGFFESIVPLVFTTDPVVFTATQSSCAATGPHPALYTGTLRKLNNTFAFNLPVVIPIDTTDLVWLDNP